MSKRFEVQYITYLSNMVSEDGTGILFEKECDWIWVHEIWYFEEEQFRCLNEIDMWKGYTVEKIV